MVIPVKLELIVFKFLDCILYGTLCQVGIGRALSLVRVQFLTLYNLILIVCVWCTILLLWYTHYSCDTLITHHRYARVKHHLGCGHNFCPPAFLLVWQGETGWGSIHVILIIITDLTLVSPYMCSMQVTTRLVLGCGVVSVPTHNGWWGETSILVISPAHTQWSVWPWLWP